VESCGLDASGSGQGPSGELSWTR